MPSAARTWLRYIPAVALALALTGTAQLISAKPAAAAHTQISIFEDDNQILKNPKGVLPQIRALGASYIRLTVRWNNLAPNPTSTRRPRFNAADPAAYPRGVWAPYDNVIREAQSLGMKVMLTPGPFVPQWASGPGEPRGKGDIHGSWEPNAREFGLFMRALGSRYSGSYNPTTNRADPGNPADLPRVSSWSIWNEPDYGPSLAPQRLPGHPGVEFGPRMYRALIGQAWNALAATGHGHKSDTFLIGELAPRSELTPPNEFQDFNGVTPISFLQDLYCVNYHYRPYTGSAASLRGCPSNAKARRAFVSHNPALFQNNGVADHPYDQFWAPNTERNDPVMKGYSSEVHQFASLATIGNLTHSLALLPRAWGSHENMGVWDTEYGYLTSPPHRPSEKDHHHWPSAATAAYWDNWAEYLSWKNPQIKSFDQYLLRDPVAATAANDYGSFSSGLLNYSGSQKGDYGPWRMPLYMPNQTAKSPHQSLEVWGGARPATFAWQDVPNAKETVTLLFRPSGSKNWSQIGTSGISRQGYFDLHMSFPSSGQLMATYTAPQGSQMTIANKPIYSRAINVKVR